jgi:hypothetical protein
MDQYNCWNGLLTGHGGSLPINKAVNATNLPLKHIRMKEYKCIQYFRLELALKIQDRCDRRIEQRAVSYNGLQPTQMTILRGQ